MSKSDQVWPLLGPRKLRLGGFRARILALCLLAVVPIILMEVRNARQSAQQSIDAMRARTQQMANTADKEYDDLLLKGEVVLDFISAAPESTGTPEQCGAMTDQIKARYNWIAGMGIIAPDGRALCGQANKQHISVADKPYFQQVMATKKLTISDFHIGVISHKPVISVLKPVLDTKGQVLRVAVLGIDLKAFSEFLGSKKIDPDVSITLYDSTGTVLARHPEGEKYVGRNMSFAPLVQTILQKKTGEYEGIGIANNSRQFAFRPFFNSSTYVAVGILDQPVLRQIHHRLIRNLLITLATIFALAMISLIGAEILVFSPIRRLTNAAQSLGEGKFESLPDLRASMPEMSEMLVAFHGMAGNLKKREDKLIRNEAETQSINRNMKLGEQIANAGYWRVDYPGNIVTWSDGMYHLFGVNPNTYSAGFTSSIDMCHPDDRKLIIDTFEMAVNLQRDFEYTARVIRPDGEIRYLLTRGFCDIGMNGSVQSIFGAIIDVTVQKETEARLQLARKAAEAASRAKSEFLSSMSHELRTPLTSIIGFADLLLMRTRGTEARHYLTLQREAGQHLLSLISDILDHSKIEAGKLQLEAIPFDLPHLLQSCIGVMANEAERKGLALSGTVGVAVPRMLVGDPGRLKQILLNLIGNAIKFTEKGTIQVDIDPTGTAGDVVALYFSVSDTGIGFGPAKAEKIFRRYAQADASTTREFGGTGLGLAISKDLVEAMGGTIGVESNEGEGSTFWFKLRMLAAQDALPEKEILAKNHDQAGRILLAEDSPVNQLLFTELLQALGHEVIVVGDGQAALSAVESGDPFDLVLMDVQMPVMDGLTATRRIRAGAYSTLPVVGMTANAMQEDIEKCLAAGMDAHIAKPVDIILLTQVIERMLLRSRVGAAE